MTTPESSAIQAGSGKGTRAVGHPVDVATGAVYLRRTDCSFLAPVRLNWVRTYNTALISSTTSPLGTGWTCKYFASLSKEGTNWAFMMPEGGTRLFPDPNGAVEKGGIVRDFLTFQEITREGSQYVITRWSAFDQQVERYVFAPVGNSRTMQLVSIEDAGGRGLDCIWDSAGRLKMVRQRGTRRGLLIGYTAEGRVEFISYAARKDAAVPLARYDYDREGNLTAAFDAIANGDSYEYDARGRLVRESLKDGAVFSFEYDERGRCTKTSGLHRFDEKSLTYRAHIGWTDVVDSTGATTQFRWNVRGQVVCEINPLGAVIRSEYDEYGRIASVTDALGGRTQHIYDEAGNRVASVNPQGNRFGSKYNERHQPVEVTDFSGYKWSCKYDPQHRLCRTTDPAGGVWEFGYDDAGNLAWVADPREARRSWKYDDCGCVVRSTDWEGNATTYTLDPLGRVIARTDALGNTTHFEHDPLGRLIMVRTADGTQTLCRYDAAGNLTAMIDGKGRTWSYRYGSCGRLVERVDPAGNRIQYRWDTEPRRLDQITNAAGESYNFEYDAAGGIICERGFDGRLTRFVRDLNGRVAAVTNASDQTVSYTRDFLGNVIREVLPDGSAAHFEYDESGRLQSAWNDVSDIRLTRDFLGRVVREEQTVGVVETKFDLSGNPIRIRADDFTIDFAYDRNRLLTNVKTGGQAVAISRNALGLERKRSLPGSTTLIIGHDSCGRVAEQRVVGRYGQSEICKRRYEYDAGADLASVNDAITGWRRYTYDANGRPAGCDRMSGSESYSYDSTGNILQASQNGHTVQCKYDHGRLTERGGIAFFYDPDGRLVRKTVSNGALPDKSWRFEWDAKDQLKRVQSPDGRQCSYEYDALGRRIEKRNGNQTVRYLWSRQVLMRELPEKAAPRNWVIPHSTLEPLCITEGGEFRSVLTDQAGAAWATIGEDGELNWAVDYRIWGTAEPRAGAAGDCPARWRGQILDQETGLHYNRFRYYDAETGRFISQDPIRIGGGLNLYGYTPNPLLWPDPYGLQGEPGCGPAKEGEDDTIPLYRAVSPAELADIQNTGTFNPSPVGSEGKYFSTTPEGATQYAQMVSQTPLNEGPYTMVQTSIPASAITPEMRATVDRGIPTVVVPNEQLGQLSPPVVVGPIPPP